MTRSLVRRTLGIASSVGAGALVALGCLRATATAEGVPLATQPPATPRLVVMITVDQLRGDYLTTWESQLNHGLARMMKGAFFSYAFQDHAITETAPGHASVLSGRFPASTGIIKNSIGVVDRNFRLLGGANEAGASPLRFEGTTLYDWLSAKDRRSRAFSVSAKDRGAILPIGRARQDVYWYSGSGVFTTSTYYRDTLPTWVQEFNARGLPFTYAGKEWRLSRPESFYKEPDTVQYEGRGRDNVFPHRLPDSEAAAASLLRPTPAMDSITALFALEGLRRTQLGLGPQTDVMAVSFSASDYVGHAYGPDSREVHENLLRLDETIGWFLDSLFRLRDPRTVIVALTSDHGVSPIPELARDRGEATGDQGLRVSLDAVAEQTRAALRSAGVDPDAFTYEPGLVELDRRLIGSARLNADSILNAFAKAAREVRGVARVDRLSAIRRADFALDPIARRWAHQVPDGAGIDLVITLTRYSYWGASIVATHGSPYDQDALVPILFYGPGVKPGRYTTFARTVDIGVTLAALVGARPLERLDGRVLMDAIAR